MENWSIIILYIIFIIFVISRIRIVPNNERRAEFTLGKFKRLRGPGLIAKWPNLETKWLTLQIGQRGELLNDALANFHGYPVPVYVKGSIQIGQIIRIVDFDEDKVQVIQNADQLRVYKCEKCGHENNIFGDYSAELRESSHEASKSVR